MSHKQVIPVVAVNASQLRDDVVEAALANGFTINEVQAYERMIEYRKAYSARPNVVAKRKLYAAKRYEKMKVLRDLLKQHVG